MRDEQSSTFHIVGDRRVRLGNQSTLCLPIAESVRSPRHSRSDVLHYLSSRRWQPTRTHYDAHFQVRCARSEE